MAGAWDNVNLPGPPNGPAWAQAAAQLMGATQNSINSGANAFQGWQNFNYQQQQRDFFQNPQNQALLQDALDPKNNNPNKYGPIFQAMIQQGGAPSFQQLLPLLQRQQLIQQDLDQNNAPQPPSSGPATSTQGASPANIHGDFSQPRIGYGTGEGTNINTLAANYNLPDPVLQRIATSVGASSPEDDLTPDQARIAKQRVADYVNRTSGGVQGGASPNRGGGNPVAQAGTENQETPQGVGGSGAVSPRPTSGNGGFNPSSGAATPNVQSAQAPVNAANPPSGAAAMVPPKYRDNPQAFADYLRKQADDLSRRSRLGELIGVPSKTAEDRAKAMNDRAKAIEEQLGKDVGQTELQKNVRTGTTRAQEQAASDVKYYDSLHRGHTGTGYIAAQQKPNIDMLRQVASSPSFVPGTGSDVALHFQRVLAQLGINPTSAAPREIFNQVAARILADQFSGMKTLATEAGEQGGRVFKSMLDIEEKANITPEDTREGILKKLDILDQTGNLFLKWAKRADQYKIEHGGLDANFEMQMRADIAKARINLNLPQGTPQSNAPAIGYEHNGYRFKGGNPNDKNNWTKISPADRS